MKWHPKKTPEAKELLKRVKNYNLLQTLSLLSDILGTVTKMSKTFQTDLLDVGTMSLKLMATRDTLQALQCCESPKDGEVTQHVEDSDGTYHGVGVGPTAGVSQILAKLGHKYLRKLLEQVKDRFLNNVLDILGCINSVRNPRHLPSAASQITTHGNEQLDKLIRVYGEHVVQGGGQQQALFDGSRAKADYLQFKQQTRIRLFKTFAVRSPNCNSCTLTCQPWLKFWWASLSPVFLGRISVCKSSSEIAAETQWRLVGWPKKSSSNLPSLWWARGKPYSAMPVNSSLGKRRGNSSRLAQSSQLLTVTA